MTGDQELMVYAVATEEIAARTMHTLTGCLYLFSFLQWLTRQGCR